MKKIVLSTFLVYMALPLMGQQFVGHRGSLYGVENTKESFLNGVKLGYDFLETDIRVTKDSVLVCSHDDKTERLGGNLVVADATIEELKGETLTQKRGGNDYTGEICTFQEYLDICRDNNVRPLIELKWSTGINNDDFSNIPLLIKTIDDNGFRESCIILTSMKKCLEYIRKNYPDVTLQFLTAQYWPNHFEWCVEQGIDADIQNGCFDAETVKKFHDKGLKVNMWTTNSEDGFHEFQAMGCDFITTDKLDANTLKNSTIDEIQ